MSIVIPAYNEAGRLAASLPGLRDRIALSARVELIVVDDGSEDATAEVALEHLRDWPASKLVRLPWNQGKGAAVRAGVSLATGDAVVFMDADLSADLADLPQLLKALNHADIAVGSRQVAGSCATYDRRLRRVTSKVFNDVACAIAGIAVSDTQCGFKAFRMPAAKLLFHLSQVDGFAFDVEVLVLADLLGFRVVEVPVGWQEAAGSRVRPWRDALWMLRDILLARRRCVRAARGANLNEWVSEPRTIGPPVAKANGAHTPVPCAQRAGAPELVIDLRDPASTAGRSRADVLVRSHSVHLASVPAALDHHGR
ncbi:MAG: glycosyltransferase family 2 protein [Acidimicrobiales bacterium]|nr:glycosyltransferase family 2 protein [Acidimicrobiales bacterium]